MPACPKCGTENSNDAKFCRACGSPLQTSQATDQPGIPTFQPPAADQQGIPTFQPPTAPTFTPPNASNYSGPMCEWHPNEPAVTRCARCGRNICQDCAEAYTVNGGDYDGKALCYDCIKELFSSQITDLQANYATIRNRLILVSVGVILGFLVGCGAGAGSGDAGASLFAGLIYGLIGGSLPTYFRSFISQIPSMFTFSGDFGVSLVISAIKILIFAVIDFFRAAIETIQKLWYYGNYVRNTRNILAQNQEALDQIEAFMEYTLIRDSNQGVDLETLMNEHSELYNNSYAQQVRTNGEQAADAAMRQYTTRIAENGEIIRDFAA